MSKLNQLIGFLEEQLTVSEPTPDYTRHNQEIITYIEYLKSMKQPQLNENQQIVLDWLKDRFNETEIKASCTGYLWKLHQSYIDDEADEAGIAYEELSYEEEAEMVRVFAEWFEQEEAE